MNIYVQDTNAVAETDGTLFSMIQQSPISALVTLQNSGINTLNYHFQQLISGVWTDMDVPGTPLNNSLMSGQTAAILVPATYPQVQLNGSESGGSVITFSVTRFSNRTSGGSLPILSF